MLNQAEIAFLLSQGLSEADVFDGRGLSASDWKAGVRAAGLTLVLGTPCEKAGHRLRTRSGHCVQCDPKKIAYQNRFHSRGFVYIAGSLSARIIKIGTAIDVMQRHRELNYQNYGGISDWEMLFTAYVDNGGEIEHAALQMLEHLRVRRTYNKEGNNQEASELLKTNFTRALKAVVAAIGEEKPRQPWMSSEIRKYEF